MNKLMVVVFLFISLKALANVEAPEMSDENGYVEPFKMFENLYYVGDKWVSSYAVDTSSGLVIIDSLDFPYSKWIPANLKKLGLEDKPVTHIFVTHGHSDHVGGAEYLQSMYGSKVIMTKKGLELAREQANKSSGNNKFLPPDVKSFAQDSSKIVVGDTEFNFYITPGHTEGDLSIDFMVKDNGQRYRAFVVGGHGANFQKPHLAKTFLASMARIKKLAAESPSVTVNLSNHPHKNNLFANRDRKTKVGSPNAFIDGESIFRFVEQQEKQAIEKLKEVPDMSDSDSANKSIQPTTDTSDD
ncbi:MBL fold metallo-hydrolase [Photobacterium sp. 53610]|uniref:MBL fold metallo-hydrolase n=1 Tax=Photobacterium sp. 53610 TaxID=3102789 RepID=UPI002EDB5782